MKYIQIKKTEKRLLSIKKKDTLFRLKNILQLHFDYSEGEMRPGNMFQTKIAILPKWTFKICLWLLGHPRQQQYSSCWLQKQLLRMWISWPLQSSSSAFQPGGRIRTFYHPTSLSSCQSKEVLGVDLSDTAFWGSGEGYLLVNLSIWFRKQKENKFCMTIYMLNLNNIMRYRNPGTTVLTGIYLSDLLI